MTGGHSVCFLNESKESTPSSTQISNVNVLLDLVCWTNDHHCNKIMTFINIFKNIFDTPNIDEHPDINMCIKHLGNVGVVEHHPSIVVRKTIWSLSKRSTIVSPTIDRVTVFALCCLLRKSSWITFFAYIVDHVECVGIFFTTQSVQQTFCDHFKKRCVLWKKKFYQHQAFYVFGCENFLLWRKTWQLPFCGFHTTNQMVKFSLHFVGMHS